MIEDRDYMKEELARISLKKLRRMPMTEKALRELLRLINQSGPAGVMKPFEMRSYGKSELAMLYFPHAQTTEGALSNLRFWIRKCRDLDEALKGCGMARQAKSYTPKEVALIVEYLGEP